MANIIPCVLESNVLDEGVLREELTGASGTSRLHILAHSPHPSWLTLPAQDDARHSRGSAGIDPA